MDRIVNIQGKDELVALMDFFEKEKHERFRQKLSLIGTQLKAVSHTYGEQDETVKDVYMLFELVREEMEQHMVKEEQLFFPFLRRLLLEEQAENETDRTLLERPLQSILSEQKRIAVHFAGIRQITHNYEARVQDPPTQKNCYRELAELEKSLERYFAVERKELVEKTKTVLELFNHPQ